MASPYIHKNRIKIAQDFTVSYPAKQVLPSYQKKQNNNNNHSRKWFIIDKSYLFESCFQKNK